MESVYKEVNRRCHEENRVTPSRNSVLRRIRALDARLVARKRLGAKSAESIALSTPGMLEAIEALELIQIDHTLADVMIVDSLYRASIGRPWLSLAIDVATRSVLGFHLGLEIPSALAVALCIEHAVLPTLPSAAASITDTSWDMFGMPKHILVYNWSEFHGETLTRGSAEYGIALTYRPVARPRFGAHIERLIGTMIGKAQISRNGDFTKSDSTGSSSLRARPSHRQQKIEKYVALSNDCIRCESLTRLTSRKIWSDLVAEFPYAATQRLELGLRVILRIFRDPLA